MDDLTALLRAVVESPADDTPRLAYADALDASADDLPDPGAARTRAEFCRVQCELAKQERIAESRFLTLPESPLGRRIEELRRREQELRLGVIASILGAQWSLLNSCDIGTVDEQFEYWGPSDVPEKDKSRIEIAAPVLRRGFIDSLTLSWADWLRIEAAVAWCPRTCEAIGPHHRDRCDGGRVQCANAQFTEDCRVCHGTGRAPRRFVESMQPLSLVNLTTTPDDFLDGWCLNQHDGTATHPRWQGITFTIPAFRLPAGREGGATGTKRS